MARKIQQGQTNIVKQMYRNVSDRRCGFSVSRAEFNKDFLMETLAVGYRSS
jgi:hypothetical protein